jgi:hypothetical protein
MGSPSRTLVAFPAASMQLAPVKTQSNCLFPAFQVAIKEIDHHRTQVALLRLEVKPFCPSVAGSKCPLTSVTTCAFGRRAEGQNSWKFREIGQAGGDT